MSITARDNYFCVVESIAYGSFVSLDVRTRRARCYSPIENQIVPMTYLVAKPYGPRGSGRGECINNGRQALPSLVRPRFLPGDQKGPGPRVYRVLVRSAFSLVAQDSACGVCL